MTVATKHITAEELFAMGDVGRCELVRGQIIKMAPAGAEHRNIAGEVFRLIANHVKAHRLGDELSDEPTLPGFALRLADLFEAR